MAGSVVVQSAPFKLEVIADDKTLVRQTGPILITRPDGSADALTEVISQRQDGDTAVYDVRTQSQAIVSVTVTPTSSNGSSFRISQIGRAHV